MIFAEGEESRVLRAVQIAVDEKLSRQFIVGRKDVVNAKIKDIGLRLEQGRDFDLIDPHDEALIGSRSGPLSIDAAQGWFAGAD